MGLATETEETSREKKFKLKRHDRSYPRNASFAWISDVGHPNGLKQLFRLDSTSVVKLKC